MSPQLLRSNLTTLLLSFIGFAALIGMPRASAGNHHFTCDCYAPCCTVYTAGDQPADLKVHVVGTAYDTIEAYFRNDRFYRDSFPGSVNLHCDASMALAPRNDYGTFAVRFGPCRDSVRVYGWKKDEEKPTYRDFIPAPNHPVRLEWITTRILKIHYGPCQAQEYILRFNDSDTPWTILYQSP